jgi:hypothetical protein
MARIIRGGHVGVLPPALLDAGIAHLGAHLGDRREQPSLAGRGELFAFHVAELVGEIGVERRRHPDAGRVRVLEPDRRVASGDDRDRDRLRLADLGLPVLDLLRIADGAHLPAGLGHGLVVIEQLIRFLQIGHPTEQVLCPHVGMLFPILERLDGAVLVHVAASVDDRDAVVHVLDHGQIDAERSDVRTVRRGSPRGHDEPPVSPAIRQCLGLVARSGGVGDLRVPVEQVARRVPVVVVPAYVDPDLVVVGAGHGRPLERRLARVGDHGSVCGLEKLEAAAGVRIDDDGARAALYRRLIAGGAARSRCAGSSARPSRRDPALPGRSAARTAAAHRGASAAACASVARRAAVAGRPRRPGSPAGLSFRVRSPRVPGAASGERADRQ